MLPRDEAALALFQATKHEPRAVADALLDQFFNFPTREEYDRTLSRVSEALQCPEITLLPSSSLSLEAF